LQKSGNKGMLAIMSTSSHTGHRRIRRSLFAHGPVHRMPHEVLRRMLDHVDPDTPPDGPDGPVASLERRVADLLGKPAAMFFPTGTMAQQTALRIHASRRHRPAFAAHPQSHLHVWEAQGYAAVHGLQFHPVGDRHRLMTGADLAALDEPVAAVMWELPQRDLGGILPEWGDLIDQVAEVRRTGEAAHLDGARLWEAQTYYRRGLDEIAGQFDSVYVSLYKGLRGIRGAVLASDQATIRQAGVWRTRLGGSIADAWPLALAALVGLDSVAERMAAFREHAIALARAINADGAALAWPDPPQTPIFHVHVPAPVSAVERAGADMIAQSGVQMFGRVRSAPDPTRCSFEISVSDNATEFSPVEIVGLIRELVTRAGDHQGGDHRTSASQP
jgi:threonine aldolase